MRCGPLVAFLLTLLLAGSVRAAELVAIPDGESAAQWTELIATAEAWSGGATGTITLSIADEQWLLVTRDPSGREHRVALVPPADDEARMEVAMVAVSLLQPPRRAPEPPPPPRIEPEPVVVPEPVVEEPPPAAPPRRRRVVEKPNDRGAFPASLRVYASLGGAVDVSEEGASGWSVSVDSGLGMPAGLRVAFRATMDGDIHDPLSRTSGSLPPLRLTVGGLVAWSAEIPVSPLLGVGGGARWNVARVPEEVFGRRVVSPQLDVLLGLSVNPPGWLRIEPLAMLRVGTEVDLFGGSGASSTPLDVRLSGGLQVTLLSAASRPVAIDRQGR